MTPEMLATLARTDLNLLRAFDALMSERSVSLAAARLSVGQPAMSASLSRLRRVFDDPLLVREGAGLVATPVAEALRDPVARALRDISGVLARRRDFDPAHDVKSFRLLAVDHVIVLVLEPVLRNLRVHAPGVRMHIASTTDDVIGQVRRGHVDVGIAPPVADGDLDHVRQRVILTDQYVWVVAADHPEVGRDLDVEQLRRLPLLTHDDPVLVGGLRRALDAEGIDGRVDIRTQSAVVAALMLEGTSMVGLVPAALASAIATRARIRVVGSPITLPAVSQVLYWNDLDDDDPAQRWLRDRLVARSVTLG